MTFLGYQCSMAEECEDLGCPHIRPHLVKRKGTLKGVYLTCHNTHSPCRKVKGDLVTCLRIGKLEKKVENPVSY